MDGAAPHVGGAPFTDPFEEWYGDTLYWFDRMVRSRHQLIERLALVFHDWWATSNDAVGAAPLTVAQTNIFRTHGLGSFAAMTRAMTADPAMLLFLNGIENRKGAINENYGRELMELFTLGADRGAYTRDRRARDLARAERLGRGLGRPDGMAELPLRAGALGLGEQDRVRQDGHVRLGGRLPAGARAPAARLVLREQALELLHPGAAVRGRQGQARAALRDERPPDPPGGRGDPLLARVPRGPAHGQAAGRARRGPAARARQADHRRALGLAVRRRRPAPVLPAGRGRLGRQALARHEHDPRALGDRQLRARGQDVLPGRRVPRGDGRPGARQGPRGLGEPEPDGRDGRVAQAVRRSPSGRAPRAGSARSARTRSGS